MRRSYGFYIESMETCLSRIVEQYKGEDYQLAKRLSDFLIAKNNGSPDLYVENPTQLQQDIDNWVRNHDPHAHPMPDGNHDRWRASHTNARFS